MRKPKPKPGPKPKRRACAAGLLVMAAFWGAPQALAGPADPAVPTDPFDPIWAADPESYCAGGQLPGSGECLPDPGRVYINNAPGAGPDTPVGLDPDTVPSI